MSWRGVTCRRLPTCGYTICRERCPSQFPQRSPRHRSGADVDGLTMAGWPHRLDHVGIATGDLPRSCKFYAAALAPLGIRLLSSTETRAAFGIASMPYLTVHANRHASAFIHLAFSADNRAQVDAFYRAALDAGGTDHGAPGLRPAYHAHYYGAFVLDPDGYNIEVVTHEPQ